MTRWLRLLWWSRRRCERKGCYRRMREAWMDVVEVPSLDGRWASFVASAEHRACERHTRPGFCFRLDGSVQWASPARLDEGKAA